MLAISRMLCSVAVPDVMLPTVSDLRLRRRKATRHEKKWLDTHAFRPAGWPGGSGTGGGSSRSSEEQLQAAAAAESPPVGLHLRDGTFARLCVSVYMWSLSLLECDPTCPCKPSLAYAETVQECLRECISETHVQKGCHSLSWLCGLLLFLFKKVDPLAMSCDWPVCRLAKAWLVNTVKSLRLLS